MTRRLIVWCTTWIAIIKKHMLSKDISPMVKKYAFLLTNWAYGAFCDGYAAIGIISIAFSFFITFWFTTHNAVVVLVCMGVGGCGCPKKSKTKSWLAGTGASWQLMNNAPTLASAAEKSTTLIICKIVITAPFLGGVSMLLDMKKCQPALLHALLSERYFSLLCAASTMLLAW